MQSMQSLCQVHNEHRENNLCQIQGQKDTLVATVYHLHIIWTDSKIRPGAGERPWESTTLDKNDYFYQIYSWS